jgi:tRNA G18 (ribose-2'-O)-methylase SpoU
MGPLSQVEYSSDRVLLTGFHAVKHALRFGAHIEQIYTTDTEKAKSFVEQLAPDVKESFFKMCIEATKADIHKYIPGRLHWTEVWAIAAKPVCNTQDVLLDHERSSPLVLLEDPKNPGNLGASIRAAAAFGASGLLVIGESDPWHPRVIQGASGLQYALHIGRIDTLDQWAGPLIVCDPDGKNLDLVEVPQDAIILFGSEREGVSDSILRRAAESVRIPMRKGVSSLNLAVSVGVILSSIYKYKG